MRLWRFLAALAVALSLAVSVAVAVPAPALAAPCVAASCHGLDPDGRCNADAVTVNSQEVRDGLLELRYSPSCKANWGRYTMWVRNAGLYFSQGAGVHARVTAWNPGESSAGTAHMADINPFASSWSQMVDGTKTACTGVELTHINGDEWEHYGWTWGPCY